MNTPVRLRLSRAKGFNLKRLSRETNGLEAISVVRPGKWGNPYRVTSAMPLARAIAEFRRALEKNELPYSKADIRAQLKGKNLACWCKPGGPCHADLLLRIANRQTG